MASAPGDHRSGPAPGAVRDRRRELGAFLRSRRARLSPAEVGLTDWGVRRVPGLRLADDPMIRIVILHPATASDAARLERLARQATPPW
jgi:hypothetical protein